MSFKIALIAMSGVRAFKPELNALGMTLPGFVERGRIVAAMPSLSLLTLAGMTPERFEVGYHEIADIRQAGELPECDLAAIGTFTAQVKDAYEVARRYRERGVKTVIGGLHATAMPREALGHVDAVVVGEGELAWPDVLADFEAGRLGGVYGPKGREFDLADAPMPRFDLLDPEKYNRITVQTARGCPWKCEFCASSILLTPRYKTKPVAKTVAEIRAIKGIWPRPFIEFADDNSFVDKKHAKTLLREVAAEGIRWFTETDIAVAEDGELLDLMRESGCAQVLVGLESPTMAGLDGVETRRNWKKGKFAGYKEAIARIQDHGIAVNGCFVLGLDGGTTADFAAVRAFVEESGLYEVQITVVTAFPGTPLYRRLLAEGRLLDPTAWEKCTVFDVNVRPKQMSVEELEEGFVELAKELYSAPAVRARKNAFKQRLRQAQPRGGAGRTNGGTAGPDLGSSAGHGRPGQAVLPGGGAR
ncbi:MAG TPA: radical SAM protein [Thermomicrobiales bacterium]|nr:radical SAM protein [Thermomicrobiales bacterium]